MPFGPPPATTPRSLRSASPNPPALWLRRAKPAFANAVRLPWDRESWFPVAQPPDMEAGGLTLPFAT
jgi:hypothetical protein